MGDLPAYPEDAAEREAAEGPPRAAGVRYASWGSRVGAYLLDVLIIAVPLIVAIAVAAAADLWTIVVIAYVATFVVPFVYFTYYHGSSGQTPGKRALGIRVASDQTGDAIGSGRAFGRYAITFVFGFFFLPLLLDYLWPLWDSKNQTLHDKVVGSVVVRS
jgi:uncharacterized RDD family membrane protein YckC